MHSLINLHWKWRTHFSKYLKLLIFLADDFVTFCENHFEVSTGTINRYLFYDLVEKYPAILLSSLWVSIIYNKRKNYFCSKINEELNRLLVIGIPVIKTSNNIVNDPDYELDMDINIFDEDVGK